MTGALPVERLRAYLRELTPEARKILLSEIERAMQRGEDMPGASLIVEELRNGLRSRGDAAPRLSNPARLFFAPLTPFLVNEARDRRVAGRIARSSLDPIWQWIARDLAPADARLYGEQVERILADEKACARLVRAFQDRVVRGIGEALEAAREERMQRRLIAQIGSQPAFEDMIETLNVLKARDALAVLASRLPERIRNLSDEMLDGVKALLDSPIARHRDVFPYALALTASRLDAPWQVVRLAIKAAVTDDAQRIAENSYAAAIALVLGDLERTVEALRVEIRREQMAAANALIKEIHGAVRTLRTELDLSADTPWARRLAAVRKDVSDLVKAVIETVPGRVRRLLRPRLPHEIGREARIDPEEVAEAERLVEFAAACRNYASEIAINEAASRVHSDLQKLLDTGTSPLLDGLRSAGESDRAFRLSQAEAAVRLAGKQFGPSYAALLAKAVEVAASQGERAAERKPARS